MLNQTFLKLTLLWLALLTLLPSFVEAQANQAADANMPSDSNGLVRRAVRNELADMQSNKDFWRYRLRKETVSGVQEKDMIETRGGIVARTVSLNDKPLTPEQRAQDDDRLAKLVADPEEQRKKQREQAADTDRVSRLIGALPNAFIYTYDGTEKLKGQDAIRLKFTPNPKFNPPSVDTYVYRGTTGFIWIDAKAERLAKLDATLTRNVSFGWGGILGHVNKGGHFVLEQSLLDKGNWKLSTLVLEATGRVLIFKTINLKQRQFGSNYRPVSPDLSIAQAAELLKRE